jgi:hypothetical protein
MVCEGDIRVKREIVVFDSKQFRLWLDEGTNNHIDFQYENSFVTSHCGKLFVRFCNEEQGKKVAKIESGHQHWWPS